MAMSKSLISASSTRDSSTGCRSVGAFLLVVAVLGIMAAVASPAKADTHRARLQLVMIESKGCRYCDLWHEEVGRTYASTPEGRRAPLVRLDIGSATAKRFKRIVYTPTFILVRTDGQEYGRIVGYPGPEHFWGELSRLLAMAGGATPRYRGPSPASY